MGGVDVVLCVAATPLLVACGYLALLALLSRRDAPVPASSFRTRFDIIVPAHDEAQGIARTVANLKTLAYPVDRFRVVVVADNCADDTAARAREAGATVWERKSDLRGKGHALRFAYERSARERFADAVVVVDADTKASPNLLTAFDARIQRGAHAIQAEYGVLNPGASWRTQLMTLAFALFHGVRSSARERLRLSVGLRGNGMCFTHAVLAMHPHQAFSVVEDVEYAAQLSEAGVRVRFAGEAEVRAEMPSGEKASRSQRRRWEEGRRKLVRRHTRPLLARAFTRLDLGALDAAVDLVIPPLSTLALCVVAGAAITSVLSALTGTLLMSATLMLLCAAALTLYVLRGWQFSELGLAGLKALMRAPGYVLWKLALRFKRPEHARGEWVRTAREPSTGGAP